MKFLALILVPNEQCVNGVVQLTRAYNNEYDWKIMRWLFYESDFEEFNLSIDEGLLYKTREKNLYHKIRWAKCQNLPYFISNENDGVIYEGDTLKADIKKLQWSCDEQEQVENGTGNMSNL